MENPDPNPGCPPPSGGQPPRGRMPNPEQAATLHERVAAVMRVLEAARLEAGSPRASASTRLLEKHRPALEAAMTDLGAALAHFLDASEEPADLDALRSVYLEPILALSRSLPIFRRASALAADGTEFTELQELLLEGRPAGFDAQSMLLGDFYQHGVGVSSLRTRVTVVMRMIRAELSGRGAFEGQPVRVLVLGANGVAGLESVLARHALPDSVRRAALSVFIVDSAAHALRRVRQMVDHAFGTHSEVLLCSPADLARHPNRPTEPFDLIYTLSQYDTLSQDAGLVFTKSILPFLKPGGVLLTGAYLPTIPRSHRALSFALAGLRWTYWDAAAWKQMLAQLPFDIEASRFEAHPPAALVVMARRRLTASE